MTGLTEEEARLREWLIAQSEAYGNAIVEVPGDADGAPYTFSVGAWRRFGVPEAVTIGLPAGGGAKLVNGYVRRASAGERFEPGLVYDDMLDGVLVTVEQVSLGHYFEFLGSAFLVYRGKYFPAIQLITSTPDGAWPWQPTAPSGFDTWQPVLTDSGRPEGWTPGVGGP